MWYGSNDEKIRHLEEELYLTRRAILNLLPPRIQEIAKDYYRIETRADAHGWLEELVEAAIEIAWPLAEKNPYSGPRAYCPLCKRGSLGPYAEGFLLPGGLRKHLLAEGNAHECVVLAPIRKLAEDHWRPRVEEAEAQERAAKEAEKEQRRQQEDQFRTGPGSGAMLRDEHLYGSEARDDESLAWAVERLRQLGFVEQREGQIRQFTRDCGSIVVFADPRQRGRLTFSVYRKEQVEKPKSRRRWLPDHQSFYLLDSWRNDLAKKLEERVEAAKVSLGKKSKT